LPEDTTPRGLSPELISLVQYVELSKNGWWDLAVQELVLAALANAPSTPVPENDIANFISGKMGIEIRRPVIQSAIDRLLSQKKIFQVPREGLKIGEAQLGIFQQRVQESAQLQETVRSYFFALAAKFLPTSDPQSTWESFHDQCLIPLVKSLGANTHRLITGKGVDYKSAVFAGFLGPETASDFIARRNLISTFLLPSDKNVREYVLRMMNASFFVEASSIDRDTLNALTAKGNQFSANIFVDTNFIFSLLNLHENPADEAVRDLFSLIGRLGDRFQIKLFVLPMTIDEATRVISYAQEQSIRIRLEPNLVDAAIKTVGTGIVEKFLKAVRSSDHKLDASEYYGPFAKNLLTILNDKGVELYNDNLSNFPQKQCVIDDILTLTERSEKGLARKNKQYGAIEHDVVAWHFVSERRPARAESPLLAKYWIVTLDYQFLAFDRSKTRERANGIPVCLHPASLAQMLQFWIPRSEEFDVALFGAMRLPLFFPKFDSEAEAVTLQILQALSRFDNLPTLSTEAITKIILNDGLRQKISADASIESNIELVESELIREIEEISAANKKLQDDLLSETSRKHELSNIVKSREDEIRLIKEQSDSLQEEIRKRDRNERDNKARLRFARNWLACAMAAILTIGFAVHLSIEYLSNFDSAQNGITTFSSCVIAIAVLLTILVRRGSNEPAVAEGEMFRLLSRNLGNLWWSALVPLAVAIYWDWVKHIFSLHR
jgi:hypothetical protein